MPGSIHSWASPPTRRELSLVLFCITIFILSYNVDTSLRVVGIDRGRILNSLGVQSSSYDAQLDPDGRRPEPWRDDLEREIMGDWEWKEGKVADGVGRKPVGEGQDYQKGSMWHGPDRPDVISKSIILTSANNESVRFDDGLPTTTIVKHVPGYTVLDNVILNSGTFFIVTDDPSAVPPLSFIGSSREDPNAPPSPADWQIISSANAIDMFEDHGAMLHGVTWLATGGSDSQDSHTLQSLWRAHTAAASSPPARLIFQHIPAYTDAPPDLDVHTPGWTYLPPRALAPTGSAPATRMAAFPTLGVLYREDWADFAGIPVPFVLPRLVVADGGAAARAGHAPPWKAALALGDSGGGAWWAPVRRTLRARLGLPLSEDDERGGWLAGRARPVVAYVAAQGAYPRLTDADHRALVDGLLHLGREHDYEVHVIDEHTAWKERMTALVKATVMVGVYGENLGDAAFIRQSAHSAVFELFPQDVFFPDQQILADALGHRYVAWQNKKQFTTDALPRASAPKDIQTHREFAVDARAVVKAVHQHLSA